MKKIKTPKINKINPKALTIEELELVRESCVTVRQRAILEVFYATGCRLDEIYKLNIQDINFQSMSIKVVGKGNIEREVYLSWKSVYHLKKYLKLRKDDCDALFVTKRYPIKRLSHRGIQRIFEKIGKQANLGKHLHPHLLRHSLATLLLGNDADIVTVQSILGHKRPETTQIYAQLSNKKKRENYKKYLVQ